MKFLRTKTSVLVVASGIILTAIGLYWLSAGRGTREARVYRIGWESDPPFQVALADGEPSGLAIELVREASRRRNIRLEWIRRQRAAEASLVNRQVDLWPLMTITPERKRRFHISEAYLEHGFFFLVRQDTPYRRAEDLEQQTLSHLNQPILTDLAKEHFPRARLIARPTVKDALAEVCEGRVDGAFVEENSALSTLLDGIPCAGLPVRMIGIPSIRTNLGVAATFGAAGVADEIREEIGTIAKEGRLSLMASRWGDFSVRNTETIQSLREARQRVSILVVAIIVFACLLLLAMWQTIHRGREANRAIRAEQTLRQTEQKLRQRESEERFRHIADTAPVIVWITDSQTLHTFFNRQAAAFTGRKVEELLGHSWIELTHPEDRESLLPVYMAALKAGRDFQLEFRLRRADQAYRWMLSTGTARSENGAYVGHVGTILDITDLKRNQEEIIATQKLESLGVLAAGIAHDFNNLLGSILVDSESVLTETDISPPVREMAQRIEDVAMRASEIVRQLLAFAGRGAAIHASVNVSQLIGEMVSLLKVSISKRAVLNSELTPEPLTVHGNAAQIQQVIMNLITNASEALGDREGFVTIRTSRAHISGESASNGTQNLPEGDYARLEVIDTGCGMTEEVKSRIFDPFFTTKFSGRGLGLSAVQGIIRSHGGALRVESVPDQGSRFVVLLPQAAEPLQREVARTSSAPSSERTFGNGTALVVEDENNLRTAVSKSLRKRGLSVVEASDGNAAIHLFKTTPCIDVVLLDMTLPGMSGTEVLAELRKIRADVKVILTTAYSREMAMSTVGEQRISEFIRKPYLISDLFALLHKVMSA